MVPVFLITVRGVFRDRVFQGILLTAVIFLLIPSVSTLSMRQVTELSLTLSLSLISFILLLLAVFLGGTSLWKDMERRYTFSVVGLPLTRSAYVVGKFAGIAGFVLLVSLVLGIFALGVVLYATGVYPPSRPVVWTYLFLAILYDSLKYILLVAISFLFSSVSTSFFLPVFGTISAFFVGSASQQVYDFVHSPAGRTLSPIVKSVASFLYYLLPNFSAFDLKVNAIYSIPPDPQGLLITAAYWAVYTFVVLSVATMIFSRRELM
ncbi:ABC transporter permease [bacterium]|nr:ABC transporter permease [bacterium]